jgi:ferredoxin/flavodoxin
MENLNEIKSVRLIYFSGTGGTKRIAEAFEQELKGRGLDVTVRNLGQSLQEKKDAPPEQERGEMDLNILVYPVYAMDAPRLVYNWIESVSSSKAGRKIAVFSVSGGGEMWPNKGCRNGCCKALESRGFQVVYDRMMVMPANVLIQYNDHLIMHLLNAIPKKASQIIDELLEGKVRRTHFGKGPVLNWVSRSERENAGKFAQGFEITDDCTSCGWCVRNCPMQNIEIAEPLSKPKFSDRCVICTRCGYGCPTHAIKSKGPFQLKSGFDLDTVVRRMEGVELQSVEKCCKGWLYKGVKDYLLDKY